MHRRRLEELFVIWVAFIFLLEMGLISPSSSSASSAVASSSRPSVVVMVVVIVRTTAAVFIVPPSSGRSVVVGRGEVSAVARAVAATTLWVVGEPEGLGVLAAVLVPHFHERGGLGSLLTSGRRYVIEEGGAGGSSGGRRSRGVLSVFFRLPLESAGCEVEVFFVFVDEALVRHAVQVSGLLLAAGRAARGVAVFGALGAFALLVIFARGRGVGGGADHGGVVHDERAHLEGGGEGRAV